ncbi:MAG: hypothetical protein II796_01425 [Oscillospiraceae bacterium]|nr:hypothetical protein [Oscillospiraceae bacterium]
MKNTNKIYRLFTGVLCVAVSIMAILFSHVSSPAKLIITIMLLICGIIMILKRNAPSNDEGIGYIIMFMPGISVGLTNTATNLNSEMLILLIFIIILAIFNLTPVFLKKKDKKSE